MTDRERLCRPTVWLRAIVGIAVVGAVSIAPFVVGQDAIEPDGGSFQPVPAAAAPTPGGNAASPEGPPSPAPAVGASTEPPITPAADPAAELTLARLTTAAEAAKANPDLNEAQKAQVEDSYRSAIADLTEEAQVLARTAAFRVGAEAEEQVRAARKELAGLPSPPSPPNVNDFSLEELTQQAEAARRQIDAARAEQTQIEAEPGRRLARRTEIPGEQTVVAERIEDLDRQLRTAPVENEPAAVTDARRARLLAAKRLAQAEQKRLAREQESLQATSELVPIRLDLANRKAARARLTLETLTREINQRRAVEADKLVDQARMERARTSPLVKTLADEAVLYAERSRTVSETITDIARVQRELTSAVTAIDRNFGRTREKVETVGMTEAVGQLLRQERSKLESMDLRSVLEEAYRPEAIREARFELISLEERRAALAAGGEADLAAVDQIKASALYREIDPEARPSDETLLELVEDQHTQVRENLDVLIRNQTVYFESLIDLDSTLRRLRHSRQEFRQFIDERVLWIPSTSWSSLIRLTPYLDGVNMLLSGENWQQAAMVGWADVTQRWWVPLAAVLVLLPLLFWQPRLRRLISRKGDEASRSTCQSIRPTLVTVVATLVLTAFWPSLLLYVGLRLTLAANATPFTIALGGGLLGSAAWLAWIELVRQIFRPKGLAESHFFWSPAVVRQMRRIFTFLFLSLPLVFLEWTFQSQEGEGIQHSVGRLAYLLFLVQVTITGFRIFRQNGPWALRAQQQGSGAISARLRLIGLIAFALVPTTLAVLAIVGYYYTVIQITTGLLETLILFTGLQLAGSVTARWLLVHKRRLAIRQARERMAQLQSGTLTESRAPEGVAVPQPSTAVNLSQLSDQSRRIVLAVLAIVGFLGLTAIWGRLLPAFNLLDTVELWTVTSGSTVESITLWNIVMALLIVIFAIIAVKNIPGLLELLILPRLPLDAGARYAVTTLFRYGLGTTGFIASVAMLGIEWSQYQWLVAGATVGLGFGLQEIFANFVSGLIILFERPIRVGDVVTIDGTTGIVTRIRIRATTVTNWDCQEFIVPNKEFVTGRLLNWTLSNTRSRLVVNVGITFGQDTDLARRLILDACQEIPAVLTDPAPSAWFEGFGPHSLQLVLRCQVASLDDRLPTINALHTLINKKFKEAGLTIPFPQQDLHLVSVPDGFPGFGGGRNGQGFGGGGPGDSGPQGSGGPDSDANTSDRPSSSDPFPSPDNPRRNGSSHPTQPTGSPGDRP